MIGKPGFKKTLVKTLLVKSKLYLLAKPLFPFDGQILMFHRVCPRNGAARIPDNELLEVSPEFLERVIAFYKNLRYDFISLDQMLERFKNPGDRKKFVVFTFDDGYEDNYTLAYPIFKKHAIPFTLYLSTDFPDGKAVLWWYLLEDLLLKNNSIAFQIQGAQFHYSCRTLPEKIRVFKHLRWMIVSDRTCDPTELIQSIFAAYADHLYDKTAQLAISWDHVLRLSEDPLVTIGAHTVHHHPLIKLSPSDMQFEMVKSKRRLEACTGAPIRHFSYPFGGRNELGDREKQMIAQTGYATATSTMTGNITSYARNNLACLPRINVNQSDDMKLLTLAVNGFLPSMLAR